MHTEEEFENITCTFSSEQIATATGCTLKNVKASWPLICKELVRHSIAERPVLVAAAATVAVETGSFRPVEEKGNHDYFKKYEGRKDIGNKHSGDGYKYRGRGFIQLTGRHNYRVFGTYVKLDLLNHPEKALEPGIAARIFAAYFKTRGVDVAARNSDWKRVRRLVNGGLNGYTRFLEIVNRLNAEFGLRLVE